MRQKDKQNQWTVLNYTKSGRFPRNPRPDEELDKMGDYGKNSHKVIGQEFDNVIIPMDTNFKYVEHTFSDKNGKSNTYKILETSASYYPLNSMLYQNLTRTREKLEIVIIENYELFTEICSLLENI